MLYLTAENRNKVPIFSLKAKHDISNEASKVMGASFDTKEQIWRYPAYHPFGGIVSNELNMVFGQKMELDPSVSKVRRYLENAARAIKERKIPKNFDFVTDPMEHQIDGFLHGILSHRLGLFWDCGVGKTKTAVDTVRFLKMDTLFVCPSRLVDNTMDEFKIHSAPGEVRVVAVGSKLSRVQKIKILEDEIKCKSDVPRVLIIGYETLSTYSSTNEKNYCGLVSQIPYDLMILDESHKLRALNTNTSTILSRLSKKAARRILMTGTPSLGDPRHLFVQMRVLMPWMYPRYKEFKYRYVVMDPNNKFITRGFKNLHILKEQVSLFSLQKTKEECLDLPERSVITKKIEMSGPQVKLYNEVSEGLHECVEHNPIALLIHAKLHQICGGTLVSSPVDLTICNSCPSMMLCVDDQVIPFSKKCLKRINRKVDRPVTNHIIKDNPKLDMMLELIDTIVNGEQKKVILWYRYINEKGIIEEALNKKKIGYIDYAKEGHEGVRKFSIKGEPPYVFLSQIQSSSGVTLVSATYTIYYSLTFDLEHYLQSRDRMYRKGQTEKTVEYHLVMRGSIDEHISSALQQKMDVNDALLRQDLTLGVISTINLKRGGRK